MWFGVRIGAVVAVLQWVQACLPHTVCLLAPCCVGCGHHKDLRLACPTLCGFWSPQGPRAGWPWIVVTPRTPGLLALDCGHHKDLTPLTVWVVVTTYKDLRLAHPSLHRLWSLQACSPRTLLVVVTTRTSGDWRPLGVSS